MKIQETFYILILIHIPESLRPDLMTWDILTPL
jgi:hypothetical protein